MFLAVLAGIPTIEVELSEAPERQVLACRRAGAKLLARILVLTARKRLSEGLGMGGGYAPPTTSPLSILLALGLCLAAAGPSSGCVQHRQVVTPDISCEEQWARDDWPGAGDAQRAWEQLRQERSGRIDLWMAQSVTLDQRGPAPPQDLTGALILGSEARLRFRLVAPMGAAVLDFVRSGSAWELRVPSMKVERRGQGALPELIENEQGDQLPLRLDLLSTVLSGTSGGSSVAWKPGRCGVLEEFGAGQSLIRRLAWGDDQNLVREEFIEEGIVRFAVSYSDYRLVREGVLWPHRIELQDLQLGSSLTLETGLVRTEGIGAELFVISPTPGQQVKRE